MDNANLAESTRRVYIRCSACKQQILRNRLTKCNKCINQTIGQRNNGTNNNDGDNNNNRQAEQIGDRNDIVQQIQQQENNELKNPGWIDREKHEDCMCILSMNPRGFGPSNEDKAEMMMQYAKKVKRNE